jgi:hypothetical protein
MKSWWQSKIIWACIIAFITAVSEIIIVMPPFDWQALIAAIFALVIGLFRAFSTTTSIK